MLNLENLHFFDIKFLILRTSTQSFKAYSQESISSTFCARVFFVQKFGAKNYKALFWLWDFLSPKSHMKNANVKRWWNWQQYLMSRFLCWTLSKLFFASNYCKLCNTHFIWNFIGEIDCWRFFLFQVFDNNINNYSNNSNSNNRDLFDLFSSLWIGKKLYSYFHIKLLATQMSVV